MGGNDRVGGPRPLCALREFLGHLVRGPLVALTILCPSPISSAPPPLWAVVSTTVGRSSQSCCSQGTKGPLPCPAVAPCLASSWSPNSKMPLVPVPLSSARASCPRLGAAGRAGVSIHPTTPGLTCGVWGLQEAGTGPWGRRECESGPALSQPSLPLCPQTPREPSVSPARV